MDAASMTVDLRELDAMAQRFADSHRLLEPYLEDAMTDSLYAIQNTAMGLAPRDTGTYRRSFEVTPGPWQGVLGNKADHAAVIERGYPANAKMPPPGVLLRGGWMKRHGLAQQIGEGTPAERRLEFLIRRSIQRRTNRWAREHPHGLRVMETAMQQNVDVTRNNFANALRRFGDWLATGQA